MTVRRLVQPQSASDAIAAPSEIIAEARAGRMIILIDDENRENEGDVVIPASFATPEMITFMARQACGLICLALTEERARLLDLPLMAGRTGHLSTAFAVSIDARQGVSTGISAFDRAHTIAIAIDPHSTPADLVRPGHVFPIIGRSGGTLVRPGHTEAAIDVARFAGFDPSGVICEIMNEDGTMARLPELRVFARRHGLALGTIADLVAYRRRLGSP
jgi:3,4-dihydroxy 2-butanone 4-phosphate synthase/GTP cyclohydrolase II